LTDTENVTVNLTNVNEAPELTGAPVGSPTFVGKAKSPVLVFPSINVKDVDGPAELAVVTISCSIPGGKKNFDLMGLASAAGLGSLTDTIVGSTHKYTLTLNAGVTSNQVENFLRTITFSTSKSGLKTLSRNIQVSVQDIHGATSNVVTQVVSVKKK
jgi:hypothetical protein